MPPTPATICEQPHLSASIAPTIAAQDRRLDAGEGYTGGGAAGEHLTMLGPPKLRSDDPPITVPLPPPASPPSAEPSRSPSLGGQSSTSKSTVKLPPSCGRWS